MKAIRVHEFGGPEVLKLEELCMLASWMKGYYKRPPFISDGFEASCRGINPGCS